MVLFSVKISASMLYMEALVNQEFSNRSGLHRIQVFTDLSTQVDGDPLFESGSAKSAVALAFATHPNLLMNIDDVVSVATHQTAGTPADSIMAGFRRPQVLNASRYLSHGNHPIARNIARMGTNSGIGVFVQNTADIVRVTSSIESLRLPQGVLRDMIRRIENLDKRSGVPSLTQQAEWQAKRERKKQVLAFIEQAFQSFPKTNCRTEVDNDELPVYLGAACVEPKTAARFNTGIKTDMQIAKDFCRGCPHLLPCANDALNANKQPRKIMAGADAHMWEQIRQTIHRRRTFWVNMQPPSSEAKLLFDALFATVVDFVLRQNITIEQAEQQTKSLIEMSPIPVAVNRRKG